MKKPPRRSPVRLDFLRQIIDNGGTRARFEGHGQWISGRSVVAMTDGGLITVEPVADGRGIFTITDAGRAWYAGGADQGRAGGSPTGLPRNPGALRRGR